MITSVWHGLVKVEIATSIRDFVVDQVQCHKIINSLLHHIQYSKLFDSHLGMKDMLQST